jgi:acyl-CoA thioesterase
MPMMPFSDLIETFSEVPDGCTVAATDDWLQGRTMYGGLSAAFCLQGAARQFGPFPPLRSAQFAFVGPASGEVMIRATLLRRGKSTVFVSVDLSGEGGLATRAMLCYGAARPSALDYSALAAPDVSTPDDYPQFFPSSGGANFFQHFDGRLAGGGGLFSQADQPTFTLWLRHRDRADLASTSAVIALTDAPPPAAFVKLPTPGPLSTMTWAVDFLTDRIETTDGWWLLRTIGDKIADGYASQATTLWNTGRQPILVCRQNIAVFA